MRRITEIIVHCSATEAGRFYNVVDIDRWHRQRGWSGIGYHYVILLDGTVEVGRPLERMGAHCFGHNGTSVGVCYVGGLRHGQPTDTRTPEQKRAMLQLLGELKQRFPEAQIYGHRDFNPNKACPCFEVKSLGIQ